MRFIVLLLSVIALTIANPVDQVKSSNPDISKLPLENVPKPADATKTSFDVDASKDTNVKPKRENPQVGASQPLNNAKPQSSTNNEKTTPIQQNGAKNTPQTTSNTQKIPSTNYQKTQPQQQQSWSNNNNQKPSQPSFNNNNNQRIQPLNSQSSSNQQPLLSASSRVRRDTVKVEAPKSAPPAATIQLQNANAQKTSVNSQKSQLQNPAAASGNNRKTREVPKEDKSKKPQDNTSNLARVPLTNGNSANLKPVNAQQNPTSTPIRKTREAPKDVKAPVSQNTPQQPTNVAKPATSHVHKNSQTSPVSTNAQKTPSTSAPVRKTREAPKDVKQTVPFSSQPVNNHNTHKVQPQPVNPQKSQSSSLNPSTSTPVRKTPETPKDVKTPLSNSQKTPVNVNTANPSTTAPIRKTREAPKDVKAPVSQNTPQHSSNVAKPATAPVHKNSQTSPVSSNAQKTPSTSAPNRKTREAPKPSEQSKIVPASYQLPLAQSSFSADNKSPTFVHPVPVDHILKKPDITSSHPVQAVKTENKPQPVVEQKPLIDQAKSPLPSSGVHIF